LEELYEICSVEAFQTRIKFEAAKNINKPAETSVTSTQPKSENLIDKEPLRKIIIPRKQASQVHARTHPYFTRRAWNVVQEYIRYYSNPGDVICDPFGGSGVTTIEALVLGRKGIYFDVNPIASFMTKVLAVAPVDLNALENSFQSIAQKCQPQIHAADSPENFKQKSIAFFG
jgi:adenine-specific DNA methylase